MQPFDGFPQLTYQYPTPCTQQQQPEAITYEPADRATTNNTSRASRSIRQSQFSNLDTSQVESRADKSRVSYKVENSFVGDFSDIESIKNEILNNRHHAKREAKNWRVDG